MTQDNVQSNQAITCRKCGTLNDADATYCRWCGSKLETAVQPGQPLPKYCPHCGRQLDSQYAATCPSCGGFLTAYAMPSSSVVQAPAYAQAQAPPAGPRYQWTSNDGEALAKIRTFGLVGIISTVISFVYILGFSGLSFLSMILYPPATPSASGIMSIAIALVITFSAIALELISIVFGRAAFRSLSRVDGNFSTPLSLSFGLYVGFILLCAGLVAAMGSLLPAGSSGTSGAVALGLLALTGFLLLGAVIALIIGEVGLLIGVWRFGSRYDEGLFRAAAILYIIPIAAIVAPILVYLGANAVERKISGYIPRQ